MTFGLLAPQFLWTLLLLPVIVLLHFIRTRKQPRLVSALFLWRQARQIRDRRKRIAPTWLLLLQLLFATLAALILARPTISTEAPPDRVVVLDASASMQAQDDDGIRLSKARAIAGELMEGGGRIAIIRAGLDAAVIAPLSENRRVLDEALASFSAGDREADLDRAIDLARAVAPDGEVHLITDSLPPGGELQYHSVAGNATNYGIVTFDASLGQAYIGVASNDPRPQEIEVQLLREGRELARSTLLVPADGQVGATFPVDDASGFLEARLRVPDSDALALDDVAYTGQRLLTVAVGEESPPVIRALRALPSVRVGVSSDPLTVAADVRVLFGFDSDPPGNALLFAKRSEEPEYEEIRDWDQGSDLLRFVDLRDVTVGLAPDLAAEKPAGWRVLASAADLRPVLLNRQGPDGTHVRVAFHPSQTDMVLRPAFPTFIANVIDSIRGEATVPLGFIPASTLEGRNVEASERILRPGIHLISGPAGEREVAASLLSSAETRLAVSGGGPPQFEREASPSIVSRGLTTALLAVALVLLLLEWLAWSRGTRGWLRG